MEFREFVAADKPWKASKDDIMGMWNAVRPYLPLAVEPVPVTHKGTRYANDGIRISGSSEFINSVLSRLKDFLQYEGKAGLELDVEYRTVKAKGGDYRATDKYVCYIHVVQSKPDLKLPKIAKPKRL